MKNGILPSSSMFCLFLNFIQMKSYRTLLNLVSFTQYYICEIYPRCHMWQKFLFFFFTAVMPLCHYTQFIFPLYYWWTLAISVFELLWIMLLWTFLYFSDSGHAYSLKLTLYLGVEHWIRGSLYADYLLHQTVLFITGYRTD